MLIKLYAVPQEVAWSEIEKALQRQQTLPEGGHTWRTPDNFVRVDGCHPDGVFKNRFVSGIPQLGFLSLHPQENSPVVSEVLEFVWVNGFSVSRREPIRAKPSKQKEQQNLTWSLVRCFVRQWRNAASDEANHRGCLRHGRSKRPFLVLDFAQTVPRGNAVGDFSWAFLHRDTDKEPRVEISLEAMKGIMKFHRGRDDFGVEQELKEHLKMFRDAYHLVAGVRSLCKRHGQWDIMQGRQTIESAFRESRLFSFLGQFPIGLKG